MVKNIQKGGKGTPLSPSNMIDDVINLESSLTNSASSNFNGCTPATCADYRVNLNNKQTSISLTGGGGNITSVEVDCPSVVGQNPIQQESTCGLFKTGAELTMLSNSISGGTRKRKSNKKRKSIRKRKTYNK